MLSTLQKGSSMINEKEKMSLAQCKKALQSDGSVYSDEQVLLIRDFLYRMAEWEYQVYIKLKTREEQFKQEEQKQDSEDDFKTAA